MTAGGQIAMTADTSSREQYRTRYEARLTGACDTAASGRAGTLVRSTLRRHPAFQSIHQFLVLLRIEVAVAIEHD